jgi:predicted nucleic acid-binding protein
VIFIDAGPLVARFVRHDNQHERAARCWAEVKKQNLACFTSNFVLDEAFTLLGRRASYSFAAERARSLFASRGLTILRPDSRDETEAVEIFAKFADQKVSFTDCVSFVLMRRSRLQRAFTFDRHFADAGFEVWPSRD